MKSRKSDVVAAAARRYQRAVETHAAALSRGDEQAITKAAKEVEDARKRLDKLVSTSRPLVGASAGAALGGAAGAGVGGPLGAAIGGAAGAAVGGYLTTPSAPVESSDGRPARTGGPFGGTATAKEIRQLKKKLLR